MTSAINLCPESNWILSSSKGKPVKLWDYGTGHQIAMGSPGSFFALSRNGEFADVSTWGGSVYAWDLDSRSKRILSYPNTPLVGQAIALSQTEMGDAIFGW